MNNKNEPNKSKIKIDIESNYLNNQLNYQNVNINQTDKTINLNNKRIMQYIKPLLFLLQKAEQIISIINLPSSSIDKYNQLKEISFKKCGLEYTPLVKNIELIKNFKKDYNKDNNNNLEKDRIKYYKIIYELSNTKNKLIDLILAFIEANSFVNLINNKDNKSFLNNSNDFNINCKSLKDDINRIINENNYNENVISDNNEINNNEESLIYNEKEKLLNYISRVQQNIISVLYENDTKFNELKEAFLIKNTKNEFLNKYIKDIDELISPIWSKYYNNEVDWFNPNKIIDKYELKTYTKSHFLLNFMNQLFTDNKNLMEALTNMEKKKNEAYNILKFPYIQKVIEKWEYLKNIQDLLSKLKEDKNKNEDMDVKKLIDEGKELINYIKEIIIEEPKKDDNTLKSDNNEIEKYNNYNDDMNIFLGRLMNGIQNMLNKVDISLKKDELMENMIKINMSKNKNLNIDNTNYSKINSNSNINTNMNNSYMNNNNITNKSFINKDISFISTNNNDVNNSKIQNMSFQVYKKKTNHISGSNVIINNNKNEIENKDNYGINDSKKIDLNKNIINNIIHENTTENMKENNSNKNNHNPIDENKIRKSIDNIINNKNNYEFNYIKNIGQGENSTNTDREDIINEEKSITVGDIGNNLLDIENCKIIKNNKIKNDTLNNFGNESKENSNLRIKNKGEDITDENLEELKNMVLEDFKSRINEEKENNE